MSFLRAGRAAGRTAALAILALGLVLVEARPAQARHVEVDVSACRGVFRVFEAMHAGADSVHVRAMLDTLLATPPYRTMFAHYNRSWRPNHLPPDVFARMILSLRFPAAYHAGENGRADQMLPHWRTYYDDLDLYRRNLRQLDALDLRALIDRGVDAAQAWLPPGWTIPDFYLPIHPNGGSTAFSIGNAQGYDFFQLPRDSTGDIRWRDLVTTISHESHHLGQHGTEPGPMSLADSVAFEFVAMFTGEGTAVKFVNDYPGGAVPRVDPSRQDPAFAGSEVARWWQRWSDQEPALFARLFATFDSAYAGQLSREDLRVEQGAFWLAGYTSPVYFVGAELYGAVWFGGGKPALFAAMKDPRELFRLYDRALAARHDVLGGCVAIPDSTAAHAHAIGRHRT